MIIFKFWGTYPMSEKFTERTMRGLPLDRVLVGYDLKVLAAELSHMNLSLEHHVNRCRELEQKIKEMESGHVQEKQ